MKRFIRLIAILLAITTLVSVMPTQVSAKTKESKKYTIQVNLGTNCVTIFKNGKPVKAMICSPSNETPVGTFYTPVKYRWHEMIGNCYAQYCTRITGSVLFHSVWYYRNGNKSTMSVAAYNVMGNKASHGCVRLLCKDAKWIYDNCALKTKVKIFWGTKKDDPLGRPSFDPIKTGAFMSWDPTDPDPNNPYQKAKPKITAKKTKFEYKSKITAKKAVQIMDCLGNKLTSKNAKIKITGKINTKKIGTYKVKYKVTDSRGNTKTKTIKYKVVDTKKPKLKGVKDRKNLTAGVTVNLLENVSAKAVSGANLTGKIAVKVVNRATKKKVAVKNKKATFTTPGTYAVTYKVKGKNKKVASKTVTYVVVDKKVKVQMKGSSFVVQEGQSVDLYNYIKSITNYKGTVLPINSSNVKIQGSVNTNVLGTYTIKYIFSNSNAAFTQTEKVITVKVEKKKEEATTEPETEETTTGEEETTTGAEEPTSVTEEPTEVSTQVAVEDTQE